MLSVVTELNSCSEKFFQISQGSKSTSFSESVAPEMGMIWPKRACLVQCFAHLISSVPNHFSDVQFTHVRYSIPVVEKFTHF